MPAQRLTIDDLRRILAEVAGEPDSIDATNGVDTELADLGYDSVAVLAAIGKIECDYGIKVDEEGLLTATTLSDVVNLVNRH
ncbi:acyl carrier protein [Saccharopolyspora phatthalungensis]|uniref:Act minimal PKS acyl carrier protein n=1 Tax=Saccharopolyspora phatthalungensis TaxID=664693 RepID=A0A840QHT2_9PSEU|nr:acyl carrier protein [Saccharopolyspora phatthalungensis]MBB5156853.1 act minimal PKS acyl carrier protein [Saccharopolyspora phatthalungensis]